MNSAVGKTILRYTLRIIGVITAVIIAAVIAVYIPAVQRIAKDYALEKINDSGEMRISVDEFRLRFPVKISVSGVTVENAPGDTMATVVSLKTSAKILPLLHGVIAIESADLTGVKYRMGTPDSLLYLLADVRALRVGSASMNIKDNIIDVSQASIDGGRVNLDLKQDTTTTPVDTTAATPLTIRAGMLQLRSVRYAMSMEGVIDKLTTGIGNAVLRNGEIVMDKHTVHAQSLSVDYLNAAYIYPSTTSSSTDTDTTTAPPEAAVDTTQWTVTADTISLERGSALYALKGAKPKSGLDLDYLKVSDIGILVTDFYNRGTAVTVPLRKLQGKERSGIHLDADGTFAMDSAGLTASDFNIRTVHSTLRLNATAGINDATTIEQAPLHIDAHLKVGMADVALAYPTLSPVIRELPQRTPLQAIVRADGTMRALSIDTARVWMQRCFDLAVAGRIVDMTDINNISGHISMRGSLENSGFVKQSLFDAQMRRSVDLPPLTLTADVDMKHGAIEGQMLATTGSGRVALDGSWEGRSEAYSIALRADSLPVKAFLPEMGIGSVSARADIAGRGLDFLSPTTTLTADISIDRLEYIDRTYGNIDLVAALSDGRAVASLRSGNADANMDFNLEALLSKEEYSWTAEGIINNLDLQAMGLADTTMAGQLSLRTAGVMVPDKNEIDATFDIDNLKWNLPTATLTSGPVHASVATTDSCVDASIDNDGLHATFLTPMSLDSLLGRVTALTPLLQHQIDKKRIDVEALQHTLPPMQLNLSASGRNLLADYLRGSDMLIRSLKMTASNDSLINMNVTANRIVAGATAVDTVSIDFKQKAKYLVYNIDMNNRPGTLDEFAHVKVHGYLSDDKVSMFARQKNIAGETGYHVGLVASTTDSTVNIKFSPYTPIIAYKEWTVNRDNSIDFNFNTKHLDANVDMDGSGSCVRLYTEHTDSVADQEDVILNIKDLQIADWMSISPFAPPIKGVINADMRFGWEQDSIGGSGTIGLRDLVYGHERVGDFDLGLDLSTTGAGVVHADVSLLVDSVKVITARGSLNDANSATPFDLDFSMIRLPLRTLNPFLPSDMAQMSGMLNGEMVITGDLAHPVFNGYLNFDSAAVRVPMIGTDFRFSENKVPVVDNVVTFDDYTITAINENPLYINGSVTCHDISSPRMNLALKARNMQVVGNRRGGGADVYGKAFIDANATVRGSMSLMLVDADLSLLRGTNVTYVMSTDPTSVIASRSTGDMVRFVSFNDSIDEIGTVEQQPVAVGMKLDATLNVQSGAVINIDLSTDGQDKVQLNGEGSLNYVSNPFGDDRLTGRYTINSGFVRYNMPMISEITFNFDQGSYASFTGDVLNPTLSISAVDEKRANVTQEGQNSRLVNFDIGLTVTGTLENMNVVFDLSTNDDITIQNELQSMSAEQRANQAMNMLLYNVYSGPGTKASSNLSGNPLYSFLTSQVNTWMANNVRGIDISFGIDQYDSTTSGSKSTATSYSYRVSKSLFNDRFKIVVGGNYSTDADVDENFSQNLINDISFEYTLNHSGSMVVKVFRHTGYESILEGEITQTGFGFVYRHKLSRLANMFRFLRPKRRKSVTTETTEAEPSAETQLHTHH